MTTVASAASEVADQLSLRWLTADQWLELREIRLAALADSPRFFLGRYEDEARHTARWWRGKCSRGKWGLAYLGEEPIGLVGVTLCHDIPANGRYIESLWITPAWRRFGLASDFIGKVMEDLAADGVDSIWLWILDGNDAAWNFYKRLGFTAERGPVEIPQYPGRSETRMTRNLLSAT